MPILKPGCLLVIREPRFAGSASRFSKACESSRRGERRLQPTPTLSRTTQPYHRAYGWGCIVRITDASAKISAESYTGTGEFSLVISKGASLLAKMTASHPFPARLEMI